MGDFNYTQQPQREIPPIPSGRYNAVCNLVLDLGQVKNQKYNKYTRQITFGYELPEVRIDWEEDDGQVVNKPRALSIRMPLNLGSPRSTKGPTTLRKFLERWKGAPLNLDQEGNPTVNFGKMLGYPAILEVEQVPKPDGRIYSNIDRAYPFEGDKRPMLEGKSLCWNLGDVPDGENPIDHFPKEWPVQDFMVQAFLRSKEAEEWSAYRASMPAETQATQTGAAPAVEDDDIPF